MYSPAVQAVLDAYHARIDAENAEMEAAPEGAILPRRDEFMFPVGPETGVFINAMVAGMGARRILELGTSYGYSTVHLAAAAEATGGRVVTVDLAHDKQDYARGMLEKAGLAHRVEWRTGDAAGVVAADPGLYDFVLLDVWKDVYLPALAAVHPKLAEAGVIVADNMIQPEMLRAEARAYRAAVAALPDMTSTLMPIGAGLEVSCKWTAGNASL